MSKIDFRVYKTDEGRPYEITEGIEVDQLRQHDTSKSPRTHVIVRRYPNRPTVENIGYVLQDGTLEPQPGYHFEGADVLNAAESTE